MVTACTETRVVKGKCDCGTDYGPFGHHKLEADFICPSCGQMITLLMCQAWSIAKQGCPRCGVEHTWEMVERVTHCALR